MRMTIVLVATVLATQPAMEAADDSNPAPGNGAGAATPPPTTPPLPADVDKRSVKIWSNGTRMAGDLYMPKARRADQKFPAIVLCAGTAGVKEHTGGRLGPILAEHGYIALAFDYRGWGQSDSPLMAVDPQPRPDASKEMTIKVKALRWEMDYADQTEDISAAISYVAGEPGVDRDRIGLWGTSYGGGLVTWVAGNDPRVKCLAAQVPGMRGGGNPEMMKSIYDLAARQARGETEPVPIDTGKLTGALAKYTDMRRNPTRSIGFNTIDAASKITAPSLFIVAEKEELADNEVVERVSQDLVKRGVSSDYHIIKGITHYGVYSEGFEEASRVEVEWYDKHLK
jgi:uncharacterized protein